MNNKKYSSDFRRKGRKVDDTSGKKRKRQFNKVGIEIMSDRPPRQRFIHGEPV